MTRPSVRIILSITIIVDKTQDHLFVHSRSLHQIVGKPQGPGVQYEEEFTLQSQLKVDTHERSLIHSRAQHRIIEKPTRSPQRSSYILVRSLHSFIADHSIKLLRSPQGLQQEAEFHYNHKLILTEPFPHSLME